jgi:hypothetical protein
VAGVAGLVLVIFLLALVQPRHAWVEAAAVLLVVFLMAAIPLAVLLVVAALRSPAGWLLVFMTLHAATVIVLSLCLEKWLANYL